MKKNLFCMVFFFVFLSVFGQRDTLQFSRGQSDCDSIEYELVVIDPGYETFLVTMPSSDFYSQQYYESWNLRYVQEWNYRHSLPMIFGDLYETYVDYDHFTNYGLELNYRLYNYFLFFEKKNKVKLLSERAPR